MGRGGASPGGTHPPATPPAGGSRQPADPVAATTQPAHPPPGHLPAQRVGDDLAGPAGHAEPPPVHGGAQLGHGARARASPVQLEQQHRPQQYAPDGQASRGLPVAPTHGVHGPGPVIEGAHAAIIADGCDIPGPPHHLLGENFHLWRASAEKLLTGPMAWKRDTDRKVVLAGPSGRLNSGVRSSLLGGGDSRESPCARHPFPFRLRATTGKRAWAVPSAHYGPRCFPPLISLRVVSPVRPGQPPTR